MTEDDPNLEKAIQPLFICITPLAAQQQLLHAMFTAAVCNAPDDETDNFTAKQLTPFYLALCETLQNLQNL